MKHLNPLRSIRLIIAATAVSAPVSMPIGMSTSAGIVATIACTPRYAAAQGTAPSTLPPLPPAVQSSETPAKSTGEADAITQAKSLLVRARTAMSEGKVEVAAQSLAQATIAAQAVPELASELQQTRQQFAQRGMTPQVFEQAMKTATPASVAPSLLQSRAASALRNANSVATQPPTGVVPPGLLAANPTADGLPPLPGQNAGLPALPTAIAPTNNPLRDQAVGLAAQAKMALDKGDTATARQLIEKANALRVPDLEYAPNQLRPWQVAMDIDRAERLRGVAPVTTASANMPVGTVHNGAVVPGTGSIGDSVQPSLYQPRTDSSRVAPASGVLSSFDPEMTGTELYQKGVEALSAGNREVALNHFKSAWQKQADLDPVTRAQLKDKLAALQTADRSLGEPESISAVSPEGREAQVKRQKWFAEVTGEIADAERMASANQPMEALDKLRLLRQRVSQADIDGTQRKNLLAMVDRVSNHMQAWVDQNKSTIELNERNRQIEDSLLLDAAKEAKADAQVQSLVDQYNSLVEERRYPEAVEVAKKVYELKPNSEIATVMMSKATIQSRAQEQNDIKLQKEEMWSTVFNNIERDSTPFDDNKPLMMPPLKDWVQLSKLRSTNNDDLKMLPSERKIREALTEPFSASFDRRPLSDAMNTISEMTGIPIFIDERSIAEEGIRSDEPITLDLKGNSISLKSAFGLMLDRLNLTYTIKNEVLTIESSRFHKKELLQKVYNVKDLITPIPNFISDYNTGMAGALQAAYQAQTHMVSASVQDQDATSAITSRVASVDPNSAVLAQMNNMPGSMPGVGLMPGISPGMLTGSLPGSLPNSVNGLGGASIANYRSLIDLIENTISPDQWQSAGGTSSMREFRQNLSLVVTAPQETHEAIADLLKSLRALQNLQVTIEVKFIQLSDTFFERIGVDFDFNIDDKVGRLPREDSGPSVAVGLSQGVGTAGPTLTSDLDIQVRNNFGVQPPFGAADLGTTGTQMGLAILSDLELFFFLQAVQGNSRTNVLNAPKVTMFDGQFASINDFASRPFVITYEPVVGDFAVAQRPIVVVLNEGTQMNVQSVVSQDKRFVRLTLVPQFTRIEAADREFTFQGRRSTRSGTSILNPTTGLPTPNRNNEEEIIEGTTVQQPTLGVTSVTTTVSVPDGGTILLGGIKRLREGRTERGTPILSKIPYLNRLFKNNAIGRETNTLMMTVTPRIIIPEEEEELNGVNLPRP